MKDPNQAIFQGLHYSIVFPIYRGRVLIREIRIDGGIQFQPILVKSDMPTFDDCLKWAPFNIRKFFFMNYRFDDGELHLYSKCRIYSYDPLNVHFSVVICLLTLEQHYILEGEFAGLSRKEIQHKRNSHDFFDLLLREYENKGGVNDFF